MTRPALHAYLEPEALEWWHDTAAGKSVSTTALLQAIADIAPDFSDTVFERASTIDASRRRRNRRKQ